MRDAEPARVSVPPQPSGCRRARARTTTRTRCGRRSGARARACRAHARRGADADAHVRLPRAPDALAQLERPAASVRSRSIERQRPPRSTCSETRRPADAGATLPATTVRLPARTSSLRWRTPICGACAGRRGRRRSWSFGLRERSLGAGSGEWRSRARRRQPGARGFAASWRPPWAFDPDACEVS